MRKLPAMQFYVGDWMKDPELRICGHGARGLWMDLLCLMHESAERGVLVANGKPMTEKQIAMATGATVHDVGVLLDELESAGVFSRREDDNAIVSRRMLRDEGTRASTRIRVRQ